MLNLTIRSALLVLLCGMGADSLAASHPNIILCMTDDQGWGDTGYNGHPHLKTPHLDQMSADGVTFTRFYAAAPVCSPTRASCYTGRHPYRMGITTAMTGKLEEREILLTTLLKQSGYRTGHFGKWHLGTLTKTPGDQRRWGGFAKHPLRYFCPPWACDVDVCLVTESKVPTWDPLLDPGQLKQPDPPRRPTAPYGNDYFRGPGQTVTQNMGGDDSRVIMDRVLPFIEEAVEQRQPFLAVIWFHTPHSPVVGGPEYRQLYAAQPEATQHYYACLTAMDEQMGRLRSALSHWGIEDDTLLWFCSDNGPARQGSPRHCGSTKGLSGAKLSLREGGIRVPGLLVWPGGVPEPMTIDAPCVTSDYVPTILELLDIPLPDDRVYDGISLLPLLRRERTSRDHPIGFLHRDGAESAWLEDQYKLYVKGNEVQLFDVWADAAETNDLSESQPDVTRRMQAELTTWKEDVLREWQLVTAARR